MLVINEESLCESDDVVGRDGIGAAVVGASYRRRCAVRLLRTVHGESLQRWCLSSGQFFFSYA